MLGTSGAGLLPIAFKKAKITAATPVAIAAQLGLIVPKKPATDVAIAAITPKILTMFEKFIIMFFLVPE
jgi:hypothetical protein